MDLQIELSTELYEAKNPKSIFWKYSGILFTLLPYGIIIGNSSV